MNERQQQLFKAIADEYIKTVQPVSSQWIANAGDFDLSSATIRNEMAALEAQGYIFHPHTSAGRVPTQKGYQYYVEQFVKGAVPTKKQQAALEGVISAREQLAVLRIKLLARHVAEFSDGAVFVAFSANDFYYTGLSNLFGQPEFSSPELVHDLSRVVDHLDRILGDLYEAIDADIEVTIGSNNPFSPACSAVLAKYRGNQEGLIGVIGPMRMDYQNNINLITYSQQLLNTVL